MASWIDAGLYPDREAPAALENVEEQVDFLARLCSSWDYGVLPDEQTVAEIRCETWRPAVDACRLLTSPSYHLLRRWHGLPALPYLGQSLAYIREDPSLAFV